MFSGSLKPLGNRSKETCNALGSISSKNINLCAIGFILALSVASDAMGQIPAGNSVPMVPTNLPYVKTFVPPPAAFDPVFASPEALQQYGFPPRPDHLNAPAAYKAWVKAVSARQTRLQSPQLEETTNYNGPAQIRPSTQTGRSASEFNSNSSNSVSVTSSNWSGYAIYDNTLRPFAKSSIIAYWIMPVAQHAFGDGLPVGWDYSSQWVGIDGLGSPDVLRAGTKADAYLSASGNVRKFYAAWIEWFPFPESRISNFNVAPGDEIFVEIWNSSATVGNAYLANLTKQQAVALSFDAPAGTSLVGNCAEWIVESPSVGGSLAPLTNYVACPFDSCFAVGSVNGGTYNALYYPGINQAGTTVFDISMTNSSGDVISIPGLVGAADLWFRDEGSAFRN